MARRRWRTLRRCATHSRTSVSTSSSWPWSGCWRNGVYGYHHYHSTAHEVLGVCQGSGVIQFGGPGGVVVSAKTGDRIVIPAGVAHKLLERSPGFLVVGAYPLGQGYDLCSGRPAERPGTDRNISRGGQARGRV